MGAPGPPASLGHAVAIKTPTEKSTEYLFCLAVYLGLSFEYGVFLLTSVLWIWKMLQVCVSTALGCSFHFGKRFSS